MSLATRIIHAATEYIRDPAVRGRYGEQWAADVEGAEEVGMSPLNIAIGAAATSVRLRIATRRRRRMLPIGPLAIALRRFGSRGQVLVATSLSALMLLGGIAMLLS